MTVSYVCVIRTDDVAYGPYDTEEEAALAARHHFPDPDGWTHADVNGDFYVCRLRPGPVARGSFASRERLWREINRLLDDETRGVTVREEAL